MFPYSPDFGREGGSNTASMHFSKLVFLTALWQKILLFTYIVGSKKTNKYFLPTDNGRKNRVSLS